MDEVEVRGAAGLGVTSAAIVSESGEGSEAAMITTAAPRKVAVALHAWESSDGGAGGYLSFLAGAIIEITHEVNLLPTTYYLLLTTHYTLLTTHYSLLTTH